MQLNQVGAGVYYIDAGVNLGLVAAQEGGGEGSAATPGEPREALLIDAGIDETVAKRVLRLLGEQGFALRAVAITHAHADHSGGAAYLVRATGAKVLASPFERTGLEFPVWEPVYLFGGAFPPAALRTKFTLAPAVGVDGVLEPGPTAAPGCPFEVEVVPLPGHSLGQVGVAARGVLFCADAVVGPEVVAKHGVPLNADLGWTLETFNLLERRAAAGSDRFFVPAHGQPGSEIAPLVAANRTRVTEVLEFLTRAVSDGPRSVEDLVAATSGRFGPAITGLGQYYLVHLTVMAYAGYLLDRGEIAARYEGGRQFLARATAV